MQRGKGHGRYQVREGICAEDPILVGLLSLVDAEGMYVLHA